MRKRERLSISSQIEKNTSAYLQKPPIKTKNSAPTLRHITTNHGVDISKNLLLLFFKYLIKILFIISLFIPSKQANNSFRLQLELLSAVKIL